jgi:hypothetical protein
MEGLTCRKKRQWIVGGQGWVAEMDSFLGDEKIGGSF